MAGDGCSSDCLLESAAGPDGGAPTADAAMASPDGGSEAMPGEDGCGCRVIASDRPLPGLFWGLAALVALRRRR